MDPRRAPPNRRARRLALAGLGPQLAIVNPPLWELGHVAWFQERWVLRHAAGRRPLRADSDKARAIIQSARAAHPAPVPLDVFQVCLLAR